MIYAEKIYSEAFEDGVDYAIQKMYAKGKKAVETAAEVVAEDKPGILKKVWGSKLGKAAVIGTGAAGLGYGGYKLYKRRKARKEAEAAAAESEAEKNYSEGFDDGVDYAIQKMYADGDGILKKVWGSKLGKAAVIGTGAAGLGYGGYKLYKRRKARKEAEALAALADAESAE